MFETCSAGSKAARLKFAPKIGAERETFEVSEIGSEVVLECEEGNIGFSKYSVGGRERANMDLRLDSKMKIINNGAMTHVLIFDSNS